MDNAGVARAAIAWSLPAVFPTLRARTRTRQFVAPCPLLTTSPKPAASHPAPNRCASQRPPTHTLYYHFSRAFYPGLPAPVLLACRVPASPACLTPPPGNGD